MEMRLGYITKPRLFIIMYRVESARSINRPIGRYGMDAAAAAAAQINYLLVFDSVRDARIRSTAATADGILMM